MRFDVVTLFPEVFAAVTGHGITRRAHELGLWQLATWNPRDFAGDRHRTVDDRPFGGGPGMVLMAEPLAAAVDAARSAQRAAGLAAGRVVVLSTGGRPLTDARVRAWAGQGGATVLVCGRYEGIDQRFVDACVDEEISIGDYVLSGGEIAAMAVIDAVVRHLPGALKLESATDESFATGLLDAPHYTRPEAWRGRAVPAALLSGHHAQIERWRREQALARTVRERPDLVAAARAGGRLDEHDERFLRGLAQGAGGANPTADLNPSSAPAKTAVHAA
ncbi:MAG: tRNA (guanosine(37)-N1)-methyltransferase TrmD [Burkholderiales bacterium]|jgi:tRNA (guanine37-N1)-methyltransferase|nr:tRNA (guanosine(37)-N1)-methyltransferase TrmD [Burkholderiales bacterium]